MSPEQPTSLTCPTCGAPLEPDGTSAIIRCKFCGNVAMLPGTPNLAGPAAAMKQIQQLVSSGNLTEAAERFQQAFGVSAQDAGHAISAMQAGRVATTTTSSFTSQELNQALQEVQQHLKSGDKIGAIKVYREHYDVGLARAKYAVEQIERGSTAQPEAGFHPAASHAQAQPAKATPRRRSSAGWIIAVILVAAAGLGIYFATRSSGILSFHYNNNGPAIVITGNDPAAPEIAAAFYNADKDAYFPGLISATDGKALWYAPVLPTKGSISAIAAGSNLIYVAADSSLLAYHENDGSLAWQTQMTDKLNYGDSVMLVTGGRVITANLDKTIQAYDAASGSLAWSMKLGGYDRTLRLMGNSLVVVDYINDNYDFGLIVVDPITGAKQRIISPACTYNNWTSTIEPDSGLVYDAAAKALYLIYGVPYGCVQRVDLASGQITWQTASQNAYQFPSNGFLALLTDKALYFSTSKALMAVDTSNGAVSTLISNPDYEMYPLGMAGGKLIVRARRTTGSERYELWGVDPASGQSTWQKNLQEAAPIDPPDIMAGFVDDHDFGWTWKAASTGLVVATFMGQPNQVMVETFNPADGTSLGKKTTALKGIASDFYDIPSVLKWQGDVATLSLDNGFYSLDVSTGKLKFVY